MRAALRGQEELPLRDQLLPDRDALHPVRHRGRLPLPGGAPARGVRVVRARSRRSSSSCCCWSRSSSSGEGERSNGSDPPEARRTTCASASCARSRCCAATSRARTSSEYVEERVLLTTLENAQNWARKNALFPLGFGLACCAIEMITVIGSPRNDLVALRRRGDPLHPAPGRPADPLRPRVDQDGADHPPALRPDARAEVGDLDGRLRVERRDVQQLRARRRRRQVPAGRRLRARLPAAARGADLRDHQAAGQDHGRPRPGLARALPGAEGTEEVA